MKRERKPTTPRQDKKYPERGFLLAAAIIIAGAWCPHPAQAKVSAVPSVSALNKMENARARGLGGAGSALGRDTGLAWLNPASASGIPADSLSFTGQKGIFGDSTGQVIFAKPSALGTVIIGSGYYDGGDTQMTCEDLTSRTVKAQSDFLGGIGFATSPQANVAVGAMLKYLKTELAEEFTASSIVVDIGAQVNFTDNLKAGVAIRNIGKGYRYAEETTPVPTSVTLGMAAVFPMARSIGVCLTESDLAIFTADAEATANADFLSAQGGMEYRTFHILSLRAGFRQSPNEAMRTFTAGLGLSLTVPFGGRETRFRLDYAAEFGGETFTQPHVIGLTMEFTGKKADDSGEEGDAPPTTEPVPEPPDPMVRHDPPPEPAPAEPAVPETPPPAEPQTETQPAPVEPATPPPAEPPGMGF